MLWLYLIAALTLAFLSIDAINAVESMHSQCHRWAQGGKSVPSSRPLVGKMIPAEKEKRLYRRLTPTQPGKEVVGGKPSACSKDGYDTEKNHGVCLWNGVSQLQDPTKPGLPVDTYPGWLSGGNTQNCGRKVYINAPYRNTTYAPVLDGCKFGDNLAEEDGCSTIWLTKILFRDLGGDEDRGSMYINNWDFDQEKGSN
ncbi:hypothetical protein PCANC_05284 [Puccinia coronata f. sp. avenae]|uniref:Secreted protein n=1 Tax=Puccinia coronata f. sp. avenae TaxID=200324 RepID=A0A2N5VYP8_9BASI|nr:hypothetical protein PCANC_05284 [Puccinia coronata f. sp. avenae]